MSESPLNKRKPEAVLKEAPPKKRNFGDRIKNAWKIKKLESVLEDKKKPAVVSTNKSSSPKIDEISSKSSKSSESSESSESSTITKSIEVIDLTDDPMEETNIRSQRILIDKQSLSTNENKVLQKERKENELYHKHFKTQLSERIKERLVLDYMIRYLGFLTTVRAKHNLNDILKIEVLNDPKKGVKKINQFIAFLTPFCDIRYSNDNIPFRQKRLEYVIKSIFTSINIWRRKIDLDILKDLLIEKRNKYDIDDLKYPKGNLKPKSCDFVCNKKIVFKRQEIEVKDYINIYYNKYNRYECSKCNQILDYPITDYGKNTNICEKCIVIEESKNASSKKYIPGRGKIQTAKRNMTQHF